MARLIDADQFKAKMLSFMDRKAPTPSETDCILDGVLNLLEEQPTVAPVKHGHWKFVEKHFDGFKDFACSECGHITDVISAMPNFCQYCGAKMDKKPISDSAYWQGENKEAT